MKQYNEAFVGIDTAKNKHAVAIADAGREGEIRYLGSRRRRSDESSASWPVAIRGCISATKRARPGMGFTARSGLSVTTASWSRPHWCQSDRASGSRPIGVMP